jgi:hypothetical protein
MLFAHRRDGEAAGMFTLLTKTGANPAVASSGLYPYFSIFIFILNNYILDRLITWIYPHHHQARL